MASTWTLSDIKPPSLLQLALALSIVKTKSPALDIREYLGSIRRHIKPGKYIQFNVDTDKRVDSITFWRQAYERSEAEQTRLLDKIYDLEQQISSLQMKGDHVVEDLNMTTTRSNNKGKRKLTLIENTSLMKYASISSKRTKTIACRSASLLSGFQIPRDISLNMSNADNGSLVIPMLRHFCNLQKILQKRKLNKSELTIGCIALSKAASEAITSAMDATTSPHEQSSQMPGILTAIASAYPSIIRGMNRLLASGADGIAAAAKITYHIVQLFDVILQQMGRYALLSAESSVEKENASTKKSNPPRSRTTKTRASTAILPSTQVRNMMDQFAQSLYCFISSSIGLDSHISPLEGFLYYLLHTSGRILSYFAFSELKTDSTLKSPSEMLPCPNLDSDLENNHATRERAAEWMSRYIIWLLSKALSSTENDIIDSAGKPPGLLAHGKLQLQKILLQGVFGENGEFKCDSIFCHQLPLPDQTLIEQVEPSQWYTQELWKIVGWDVLLSKMSI